MPFTFLSGSATSLAINYFFVCVLLAGLWVIVLLEVFKDIRRRAPQHAPLWVLIILFFGPLGVVAWLSARPDLPSGSP